MKYWYIKQIGGQLIKIVDQFEDYLAAKTRAKEMNKEFPQCIHIVTTVNGIYQDRKDAKP